MAHQYAPAVEPGGRVLIRRWPDTPDERRRLTEPRADMLLESRPVDGQNRLTTHSPYDSPRRTVRSRRYARTVEVADDELVETTTYRLTIPWFGWLFRWPVGRVLARTGSSNSWWAPPDRLDPTQILVVGLLAAASMSAAFVNTLFTQTVNFAADDFGASDTAIGVAGAVVRAGIVLAIPAAVVADRIGRRRVIVAVAWIGPLLSVLGAFAPSFAVLVATQAVARPMGIALAFLVGVVASEEMPRNSRTYAVSILAMAAGLGAGIAVIALRPRRPRRRWLALRLPARRHLVRRRARPRPAPSGDPSLHRRPHRRPDPAAPDEPSTFAAAQRRRLCRQHLHRSREPLPEQLPQRRPRVLRGHDRRVLHCRRNPGEHRPDRRRADRRHPRSTTADRRHGAARDRRGRRRVRGGRRAAVDPLTARGAAARARRTQRSPCIAPNCSPPATAAGRPGSSRPLRSSAASSGCSPWAHCSMPTGRIRGRSGDPRNRPVDRHGARRRRLPRDRPPGTRGAQPGRCPDRSPPCRRRVPHPVDFDP